MNEAMIAAVKILHDLRRGAYKRVNAEQFAWIAENDIDHKVTFDFECDQKYASIELFSDEDIALYDLKWS
jgi:hypothetical protein